MLGCCNLGDLHFCWVIHTTFPPSFFPRLKENTWQWMVEKMFYLLSPLTEKQASGTLEMYLFLDPAALIQTICQRCFISFWNNWLWHYSGNICFLLTTYVVPASPSSIASAICSVFRDQFSLVYPGYLWNWNTLIHIFQRVTITLVLYLC